MNPDSLFKITSMIASVLLLSACASVQFGHDFDIKTFETNVKHNASTKSEVKAWLGAPSSRGFAVESDGTRAEKWGYFYGNGKLPKLDNASLKILEVEFNQQGVVTRYNWSE